MAEPTNPTRAEEYRAAFQRAVAKHREFAASIPKREPRDG